MNRIRSEGKHKKVNEQKPIIIQELNDITAKWDQWNKIFQLLEAHFFSSVELAGKKEKEKKGSSHSKASACQRKAVETKLVVDKMEESIAF